MPNEPDHLAQQMRDTPPTPPPFTCHVAGVPFRKPDFSLLAVGDIVNLMSEPTNEYDPNAIKVLWVKLSDSDETQAIIHLGYIPKMLTAQAAAFSTLRIVEIEPSRKWSEILLEEVR